MMWLTAVHEWRVMRADPFVATLGVVFAAVAAVAFALGLSRAATERRDISDLAGRTQQERAALQRTAQSSPGEISEDLPWGARHPDYVGNERGTYAVLPPAPLSALAVGQGDLLPNHYKVTARLQQAQVVGDHIEHPLVLFSGQLDLLFVFVFLYPLFILAMSTDLTASERESGTLRMLAAQPVRLSTILWGKIAARAAIVLALPVVVMLAVWFVLDAGPQGATRAVQWTSAVTAYGVFWLGLAVLINALGLRASTNAVVLAGLWLIIVVLAPSVINLASRMVYPVPSRVQFATAIRAATRDAMVEGSRQLGRFLEDHPAAGTGREGMQQYALLQATRDRAIASRAEPVRAIYEQQLAKQRRFVGFAQFASPAVMMQIVLTDIAGTSGARHRGFYDQVSWFQQQWSGALTPKIMSVSALTVDDLNRLPAFTFVEESASTVTSRNLPPLAGLVMLTAFVWWVGVRRYGRYQVVER